MYKQLQYDEYNTELVPRIDINPLFIAAEQLCFDNVEWIGASFGLTGELFRFWSKNDFLLCYTRLTQNEQTGEYTCIMLKYLTVEKHYVNIANS